MNSIGNNMIQESWNADDKRVSTFLPIYGQQPVTRFYIEIYHRPNKLKDWTIILLCLNLQTIFLYQISYQLSMYILDRCNIIVYSYADFLAIKTRPETVNFVPAF